MSFTVGLSSRPCFLALITSIPRKRLPRQYAQTKLWAPVPPAYRGSLFQTRASSFCNKNCLSASSDRPSDLFRKTETSRVPHRIFRYNSSSSNDYNAPNVSRKDLPSQEEGRRSLVSKRFSNVMDHVQSNIFIAGQRLNDLTGYSGIEALKKDIEEQGRWRFHSPPSTKSNPTEQKNWCKPLALPCSMPEKPIQKPSANAPRHSGK